MNVSGFICVYHWHWPHPSPEDWPSDGPTRPNWASAWCSAERPGDFPSANRAASRSGELNRWMDLVDEHGLIATIQLMPESSPYRLKPVYPELCVRHHDGHMLRFYTFRRNEIGSNWLDLTNSLLCEALRRIQKFIQRTGERHRTYPAP